MASDSSPLRERTGCAHFVLAKGVVAEVEFCASCGIFHVNVDSVSLRFRATALRDLRDTLSVALANYERAVAELPEARALGAQRDDLH